MCKPVFRVEDTDGEPLEYQQLKLPGLPFIERANEWGISVKAIPGNNVYHGYYIPSIKEIHLSSPEEKIFFHELSHAAHERVMGTIQCKQDPMQEIVAELSAAALCALVGTTPRDTIGNSYEHIKRYADKINLDIHMACIKVLSETEKVLNLILRGDNHVEHSK
jgi:antirestriction protein ArdC